MESSIVSIFKNSSNIMMFSHTMERIFGRKISLKIKRLANYLANEPNPALVIFYASLYWGSVLVFLYEVYPSVIKGCERGEFWKGHRYVLFDFDTT